MDNNHQYEPLPTARNKPDQRLLFALAAGIVVMGIAAALWFQRHQQPLPVHPEAGLFRALQEPRALLIGAFRSYDSEAQITEQLKAAGLHTQRSVLQKPPSPRYPPRATVSVEVAQYVHLAVPGTLTLAFFNDRLMEADFRPDDPARYAPRMHQQWPGLQNDSTGHAEWRAPPLRIWSSVDLAKSRVGRTLHTDAIILWQDERLIAQRDDWDSRFGAIPIPATE